MGDSMIRRYSFILGVFSLTLALGAHAQQQGGAQAAGPAMGCDNFINNKDKCQTYSEQISKVNKDLNEYADEIEKKEQELKTAKEEDKPTIQKTIDELKKYITKTIRERNQGPVKSLNDMVALANQCQGDVSGKVRDAQSLWQGGNGTQRQANGALKSIIAYVNAHDAPGAQGAAGTCSQLVDQAGQQYGSCQSTAEGASKLIDKVSPVVQSCAQEVAKISDHYGDTLEEKKKAGKSYSEISGLLIQAKAQIDAQKSPADTLNGECKNDGGDVGNVATNCMQAAAQAGMYEKVADKEDKPKDDKPKDEQAKKDDPKKDDKSKEDQPKTAKEDKPKEDTKNALANACTPGQKTKADGTPCPDQNLANAGVCGNNPATGQPKTAIECAMEKQQQNQQAQVCGTGVSNITLPDGTQKACNGGTMNTAKTADNLQGKSANNADARGVDGNSSGDAQQLASLPGDGSASAADGSQGASNARSLASDGKASYNSSGRSLFGGSLGGGLSGLGSLSSGSGSSAKSVEGAKTDAAFFANAGSQEKCKQAKYKNTVGCRRQRQMLEEAKALGKKPAVQPASLDFKNFDN
jgi:DNA-binding FrmR family transcriptional regulator